jgi:hypothetical protein
VVVAIVVVILAFALTGVIPLVAHSSGSSPQSFSTSRGPAQTAASGVAGGPWSLLLVVGVATHSTYSGSAGNITGLAGSLSQSQCTYTGPGGTSPTLPTSPAVGNVSQGSAGLWAYLFTNTTGATLIVSVTGSSATVVGTLTGSACDLASAGFLAIPSTGIIDSTTASADAAAAGGYGFLAANPTANATFLLVGGYATASSNLGALWIVQYLSCSLSGPGPAEAPAFVALVSATGGGVIDSDTSTATCPSTSGSGTPLTSALALATPSEAQTGPDSWANFTVDAAAGGLTWSDLTFTIQSPTAGEISLPAGSTLAVLSITGSSVASFNFATQSWTGQSTGPITSSETLSLETSGDLFGMGYVLVVDGGGGFTGSLSATIP